MPDSIVEGVNTTTVPRKVTDPRLSHKVSILNEGFDTANHGVLQTRMHIVLCYKKLRDNGDSGWHVGGWIKDTLAKALDEDPILAGRLARRSEDGGLEIVSNDSGVRIVEARIPLSLAEFLESEDKDEIKTELVSWKGVDESNPQFSALFYIQVRNDFSSFLVI